MRFDELGQLTNQQIATLVGVAPLDYDSGRMKGKRWVLGDRAPVFLYPLDF